MVRKQSIKITNKRIVFLLIRKNYKHAAGELKETYSLFAVLFKSKPNIHQRPKMANTYKTIKYSIQHISKRIL